MSCVLGYSPDQWNVTAENSWPVDKNNYFDELFDVIGIGPHEKIKKIIEDVNNDVFTDFERAAVAALLNSVNLTLDYLNMDMVICMVHDVLVIGSYEVTAGHYWNQDQVLSYFTLTWTGPLP